MVVKNIYLQLLDLSKTCITHLLSLLLYNTFIAIVTTCQVKVVLYLLKSLYLYTCTRVLGLRHSYSNLMNFLLNGSYFNGHNSCIKTYTVTIHSNSHLIYLLNLKGASIFIVGEK